MTSFSKAAKSTAWLVVLLLIAWRVNRQWTSHQDATYPGEPIQVIVPYPAGGGSDTFVRILQKGLVEDELLEQPLVVINQGGGGGTIGSRAVRNARPDGYTILCHHNAIITAKLSETVNFGPEAFEPIALTGSMSLVIIVREDSPFQNVNDLIQQAQATPNEVCFGANQGAPAYFAALQLERSQPGAAFNIVSASGGADRYTSLIGGHLQAAVFSLSEYLDFQSPEGTPPYQNIRAIAVMNQTRHPAIPDVMTCIEQGVPVVMSNANYWWAPKNTPPAVVDHLATALSRVMQNETVRSELTRLRIDPDYARGDELRKALDETVQRFESVAVKKQTAVPDCIPWLAVLTGIMFLWTLTEDWLNRHNNLGPDEHQQLNKPAPFVRRPQTAAACFGVLIGYVLMLELRLLPFAISTTLMVMLTGLLMTRFQRKHAVTLLQISLLTGLSMEFIFTQVFVTSLP